MRASPENQFDVFRESMARESQVLLMRRTRSGTTAAHAASVFEKNGVRSQFRNAGILVEYSVQ